MKMWIKKLYLTCRYWNFHFIFYSTKCFKPQSIVEYYVCCICLYRFVLQHFSHNVRRFFHHSQFLVLPRFGTTPLVASVLEVATHFCSMKKISYKNGEIWTKS